MPVIGDVKNLVLPTPKSLSVVGGLYYGALDMVRPGTDFEIPAEANLLGFLSDDALDEEETRNTNKIYAWGSDQVAEPQTEYGITLSFVLLEFLNINVAKLAYGDSNVTSTPATATLGTQLDIKQTSDKLGMRSWIMDTFSGATRVQRFYPLGEVTSKKTQKWSNKEILAHSCVATFYPDASGTYAYTRTDDGVLDAS